ncbi:MAG: hypothetical protein ACREYE_19025 [Gammaproteobacteria bacterium]
MSETIAITGKSVKLFKGHYTRFRPEMICSPPLSCAVNRFSANPVFPHLPVRPIL